MKFKYIYLFIIYIMTSLFFTNFLNFTLYIDYYFFIPILLVMGIITVKKDFLGKLIVFILITVLTLNRLKNNEIFEYTIGVILIILFLGILYSYKIKEEERKGNINIHYIIKPIDVSIKLSGNIFALRNNFVIYNISRLTNTLRKSMQILYTFIGENKVLFINTVTKNKTYTEAVSDGLKNINKHFLCIYNKWVGGFITNFKNIYKRAKFKSILNKVTEGEPKRIVVCFSFLFLPDNSFFSVFFWFLLIIAIIAIILNLLLFAYVHLSKKYNLSRFIVTKLINTPSWYIFSIFPKMVVYFFYTISEKRFNNFLLITTLILIVQQGLRSSAFIKLPEIVNLMINNPFISVLLLFLCTLNFLLRFAINLGRFFLRGLVLIGDNVDLDEYPNTNTNNKPGGSSSPWGQKNSELRTSSLTDKFAKANLKYTKWGVITTALVGIATIGSNIWINRVNNRDIIDSRIQIQNKDDTIKALQEENKKQSLAHDVALAEKDAIIGIQREQLKKKK